MDYMSLKIFPSTIRKNDLVDVAWIPTKLAIKGTFISLKKHGEWDDGWLILETHGSMDSTELVERKDDYRHHGKATDI